ncbi:hypothetical protein BOTNAR_0287g00090 [Botryotinia narcissicola]|uniref:Uncharacterized protein n=1 Tax=Botryotinia narcissicola TaxID=278944 RepID=A0A4Z1HWZ2_9HELO|nr:hypothetical protein BOTNAR_0287g00090 [Botryotinia narcissicola]
MSKHGILTIEMRRGGKEDEELRAVRFRTFVGHRDDTASVVAKGRSDFVGEGNVPDGGAAFWGGRRGEKRVGWGGRAGLDHEGGD